MMGYPLSGTGLDRFFQSSPSSCPVWLLVLSGLLIFSPLLEGGTTHFAVMILRLMILLLAGVYLGAGIWIGTLPFFPFRLGPPIVVYLALAALSTTCSPYTNQSLQWFIVLVSYAGLLYLIASFIIAWDHVTKLITIIIGMGVCEAGGAVVQAVWHGQARPTGTFFNPNFLAGYLTVSWMVLLGYSLYYRCDWFSLFRSRFRSPIPLFIPVAVAILALLLVGIALSGSRGGLSAMLIGTSCIVGMRFGRRGLGVLILLVLIGLWAPHPLHDRLRTEHVANPLGYARWQIWQSSIREMMEHPLGIGLGLYQYTFPRYTFPVEGQIARYGKVAHTAHNEFLQMGVELGILSIPIFCWGVILVVREAVSVLRQRLRRWQRGTVVGLTGGIAGILVHAMVDSNLHEPALAILLIICVAIVISTRRLDSHDAVDAVPQLVSVRSRSIWVSLGIVTMVVVAVVITRVGFAWVAFESASRVAARKDFTTAITYYQIAVEFDPGKALYHSSLAATYLRTFEQTGDLFGAQEAIEELRTAIALNPLDSRLPALLGHVYVTLASSNALTVSRNGERMKWLRSALTAYERAMELEPFSAPHYFELGRIYFALGFRETAENHVKKGIELEPNFLPAREWLANVYLESERRDVARHEYQEILSRQQKYANWNKDQMEERFLKADVSALQAALEKVEGRRT